MNIEIGTSTFRLQVDEKFRNIDVMSNTIKYEMSIDKIIAYKTIKKYFNQMVYVFLYRSIVFFILSLILLIPMIFNIEIQILSILSIITLIVSFVYCIKFFNLWKTVKVLTEMTYSFIEMEMDIEKNPE